MNDALPPLAITPGEPAGIGPDLVVTLAQQPHEAPLVAIADPDLLVQRAQHLGLPLRIEPAQPEQPPRAHVPGTLHVHPVSVRQPVTCGQASAANAEYVLETLRLAVQGCQLGHYAALVTGPVHKGVINDAGIAFTGHTEYLAELTHTDQVVMMLMTDSLRVALATTHLPLRQVPDAITQPLLERVIRILHHDLQTKFAIAEPNILVCGLNPHAGEEGHLGHEDGDIIAPVLHRLRAEGMQLQGPLPADTLFVPRLLDDCDAVLAMYHDQGLPVLKHQGFGRAINVTLGLPIIRTSVDHGTALHLAGSGTAEAGSLEAAIQAALDMTRRRQGNPA